MKTQAERRATCEHPRIERYVPPGVAGVGPDGLPYEWCLGCGGVRTIGPGHEDDEWEYEGDGKNKHFPEKTA
jgi:ferredoxin-like protein FixX